MAKRAVENHPYRHKWITRTDYVNGRNSRGRVIEVKSVEKCEYCPTLKITRIDCTVWENWKRKGRVRYKYDKGTILVRMSRQAFMRDQFLATTNLDPALFGRK